MSYCHLNARERTGIFYLRQQGLSIRHIGRRLKRSHTTISRELRRNQHFFSKHYCDKWAQLQTDKRKAIGRHLKEKRGQYPLIENNMQMHVLKRESLLHCAPAFR